MGRRNITGDWGWLVRWAVAAALVAMVLPVAAQRVKGTLSPLDTLATAKPELRVVPTNIDSEGVKAQLPNLRDIDAFRAEYGLEWGFTIDQRTGRTSLLEGGAIPAISGAANHLAWRDFGDCPSYSCIPVARVESIVRAFLEKNQAALGINANELVLDPLGSGPVGESLYFLRFDWHHNGIPVEGASVHVRINSGNIIQVASEKIGDITLDTSPVISSETALEIVRGYAQPYTSDKDRIVNPGTLVILPITPKGQDPNVFVEGAFGRQIDYLLVWRVAFEQPGVVGRWEGLVDAHTGELLAFRDALRYGRIHGGTYPQDGHTGEADRPYPYADTGLPAPNDFADAGGLFPGNNATTTLTGKYTHIQDDCGAISNTTTTGDVDFSMGAGTDCAVPSPNPGGAGNTHSTRTLYWNVTMIHNQAWSYFPTNTWLNSNYITCHVNQSAWCNATSGGATINFFRGVTGCWNLGEIPAVALHEWGHSWDDYDGGPAKTIIGEAHSDWCGIIWFHDSCTGRGAFMGANCDGYGNACTSCDGIRDANRMMHTNTNPWTAANHGTVWGTSYCGLDPSYPGACGWEDHCESGLEAQALWELATVDLPTLCSLDATTAWQVMDRLWWSISSTTGDPYTCTPPTSDGCGGVSLYTTMRAVDDTGDGTANGTPHAAAIFSAFNRHNIACGLATDPQNQNQTNCPTLTVTTLGGTAGSNSVTLTWPAVTNAVYYNVYRNESVCTQAFTRVGRVTAPTTTFQDTTCVNGMAYNFRFEAVTATDSCASAMSNCVTFTPQPCAGSVTLDKAVYNCADTVGVTVLDSNVPGAPATITVTAWSTTDPTPKTITLTNTPAGSANYVGSFTTTTSGSPGPTQVRVAHGATLTVRYVDADYCGTPNVNVDATAPVDCAGPVISNVQAINVTGNSATITWTTDENANSRVTHGTAVPPGTNTDDLTHYVTSHSVLVTGLLPCTPYFYSVTSADIAGNSTTANNGGAYYTFTTGVNVNPIYTKVESPPLAIPDNTTVYSDLAVPDDKIIQKVVVTIVQLDHTYDGDLDIYLQHPDGTLVELTTDNGSSGENFINTVFDDAAATSITTGTAPFTGTYRPEGSLATLNGKSALGTWRLRVADDAGGDTGTLTSWSLNLLYPAQSCGPAVEYDSSTIQDVCATGGPGNGNGYIDPGETITLPITLHNNGTGALTGVLGSLTTTNPNVTITNADTSFPNIPYDGTATSVAPHVAFTTTETGWTCGNTIDFVFRVTSNEGGPWDLPFTLTVGQVIPGGTITVLSQNFDTTTPPALPTGWATQVITGNAWTNSNYNPCSTPNSLRYAYNSTQAANSYAFTPGMALTAGVTYTCSFNYRTESSGYFPESLEVWVGTGQSNTAMTTMIWSRYDFATTTCTNAAPTFTVPSTGTYYIGFRCVSDPDEFYLYVDDVVISYTALPQCNMYPCTSGPAFDMNFRDQYNRAEICLSSTTGDYIYNVLTGAHAGDSFTGKATLTHYGTSMVLFASPCTGGASHCVSGNWNTLRHTAAATLKAFTPARYSQALSDANYLDSPPCATP